MYAILNYTNSRCELEMVKSRLALLMDRKEKLYCKYFPVASKIKEVYVDGGNNDNDKMANYLYELYDVVDVGTGKSLGEEIEEEQKHLIDLENYINNMINILGKMKGIEHELFYEIVFNGKSVTNAVEDIAERYNKDTQTIWKNYYRNIKKEIKKISNFCKKIQ